MNKAALKRLNDAIDLDDLEGVQRALEQGAGPADNVEGVAIPAFYLNTRRTALRHGPAMLDLFLQHGLDPNLRFAGRHGQPLRVGLGTPLLLSVLAGPFEGTPDGDDPLVQRLLAAGADPLQEETSGLRRNAWHLAAYHHREAALELLDRATDPAWTVPQDRIHPIEQAFDRQRFRDTGSPRGEAVAQRLLQRFPDAFVHRYQGATPIMRLQRNGVGTYPGVLWAWSQGAAPVDAWTTPQSSYFDPEQHPVLPAGRPFSVWPTVVRTARKHGLAHPMVQKALNDPVLMNHLNEPLWQRDLVDAGGDDARSTPLSLALHTDTHYLDRHERERWERTVHALVERGALTDDAVDPTRPTPGQRWVEDNDLGHATLLDRYPAWDAAHPVSGRTPLFEAVTAEAVEFCLARGQRLDHVDAHGDQAFATLIARGITTGNTALTRWSLPYLAKGDVSLDGRAQGRAVRDWVGSSEALIKAMAQREPPAQRKAPAVGTLALHAAVDRKSLSVVRKLLDQGADVNVQDHDGLTPLMRLMTVPVTTLTQVIKRTDMAGLLAQAGARGDATGTVRFDVMPHRSDRRHGTLEPGLMATVTGSALHLLAVRGVDGRESVSPRQRFALVKTLINLPGACDEAAWSGRCSDLVAQVLLDAQDAQDHDLQNRPPPLNEVWNALNLDRLSPAQRADVTMAMLDPRRVLSDEEGAGPFLQGFMPRYSPERFDAKVQWLFNRGAHALITDLNGRRLQDAMQEWVDGTHAPAHLNRLPSPPRVSVNSKARPHMLAVWKPWVDVALEARDLQSAWQEAMDEGGSSPSTRGRRRL